jgi:thiol:disulfide interchange protein DsbD
LLALLGCTAHAADTPPAEASTPQVTARLLAPVTAVRPGQVLTVGLQQRIAPHWHTYWVNPGDSGLATTIAWALPTGAQAGPIVWPLPQRFVLGDIVNYGYADEAVLLQSLQVPASLRDGETFRAQATVDWLVCEQTCIPQQVVLGLALPVRAGAPGVTDAPSAGPDATLIAHAAARLPAPAPAPAQWRQEGSALSLQWSGTPTLPAHDEAYFYPARWGQVTHAGAQRLTQGPDGWRLQLAAGDAPPKAGEAPDGVLVLSRAGQAVQAYALGDTPSLPLAGIEAPPNGAPRPSFGAEPLGLAVALGLALLGGLVLNLMPCVFPVLSIKALSLLGSARESPQAVRVQGLLYTAGVLSSFIVLAGLLIVLKAGGASVGWGFQFQSPVFVLLTALLMFGVGLGLSGLLTLGASVTGLGSSLAAREGPAGSFFTGVLATVVATPCTAPFMGAALGYAVTQPAVVTLAVFLSLGFGLALPYLLLCYWPALQRRLPRPGAWMERLKQALAFPMYGTAAWLVWVLAQQAGAPAVALALGSAVVLGFAAWLHAQAHQVSPLAGRVTTGAAALVAGVAVGAAVWGLNGLGSEPATASATAGPASAAAPSSASHAAGNGWETYSPERLQALRSEGKPVFVNLTAAWCLTCLVNERVALGQPQVDAAFEAAGITRLKGDWTRPDERITHLLAQHGRDGVPLYLLYPAGTGREAVVLPQVLTPDVVLAALADAAKGSP